jgi:hypothetical protein
VQGGKVAPIGGTDIFSMFLDRYDVFWLSQAPHLRLPGGVPVFHGIPARSAQQILAAHGLKQHERRVLDTANDVAVAAWRR